MLGKGYTILIHDQHVSLAKLMGANKEYIEREIPHLSRLMCGTAQELVERSEVIVVTHRDESFRQALRQTRRGQVVIDLVRIAEPGQLDGCEYYGICW